MLQPESLRDRFDQALTALGPFEQSPHLAVAVSGGSDSLALLVLLREWVRDRGGRLTALTVNHGLRAEAADECRRVGEIVADLNLTAPHRPSPGLTSVGHPIEHVILSWEGGKPAAGLMAKARAARYRLLAEWCRAQDVLHLAVAHHADDQAETVLMRQDHGSSVFGLAGMAGLRPLDGVRLLRPLLGCRKTELRDLVATAGLDWIEDPSNRATQFERVRWRQQLGAAPDVAPVLQQAEQAGQARDRLERRAAHWLAAYGRIDPAGFMSLHLTALRSIGADLATHILRQAILTVGGADFAPAPAPLARLIEGLVAGSLPATTLGGCLVACRDDSLFVFREVAECAGPVAVAVERPINWDHRFNVTLRRLPDKTGLGSAATDPEEGLAVAAIGERGMANRTLPVALAAQPAQARAALPALWRQADLVSIGALATALRPLVTGTDDAEEGFYKLDVSFRPSQPATSCGFTVVIAARHTM